MKKYFISLAVGIATFGFAPIAFAAPVPQSFVTNISMSNPQPLEGESSTISMQLQKWSQLKKVEVMVDGAAAATCKAGKKTCVAALGPFDANDVGDHEFSVVLTPKKGAAVTTGGTFHVVAATNKDSIISFDQQIADGTDPWLMDWKKKNVFYFAKNNDVPQLDRMSAPLFEVRVGKKLPLTAWAKNKSELLGMGVYIDDEEVPASGVGSNCVMCTKGSYPANSGRLLGPFKAADIGEHTYTVLIIGKNGWRRTYSGTFEVKP